MKSLPITDVFTDYSSIIQAIELAIIVINPRDLIYFANDSAEKLFTISSNLLINQPLTNIFPFSHPIFDLISMARQRQSDVFAYFIDWETQDQRQLSLDIQLSPLPEHGFYVITMQERNNAIDRQQNHRRATRTMTAISATFAHEIKNPLAAIRGAAQLLEKCVTPYDRQLTQMICAETDRICSLTNQLEEFETHGQILKEEINIHTILLHVERMAKASFATHINFITQYDPSLPKVFANKNHLIQIFLNLVKNAAEAAPLTNGEITITSAYRPNIQQRRGSSIALPLEITVRDNGAGVTPELLPFLFAPFVTSKTTGRGLGLAIVAQLLDENGGEIEYNYISKQTVFRVFLPKA